MIRSYNKLNKNLYLKLFIRHYSNYSNNIVFKHAIKIYSDPLNQRNLIRTENSGKIGIYSWVNKINGKFYVGSGDPLYLRISDYYQNWYILFRSSLYIVKAISNYGMKNFSLVILEYSDSKNLIICEQKWIDFLKPEYNIKLIANNSKGYKHTVKNVEKIRKISISRKHIKVEQVMNHSDKDNPFCGNYTKSLNLIKAITTKRDKSSIFGIEVEITDLETKITTVYKSIRKAAKTINSDIKTILRREKSQIYKGINTPYRGRYLIFIKR